MRIIAGKFGSRRISAPTGKKTRPTLDKVREAVFSLLGSSFEGGVFLDLYAGSGANGLEALSRGFDKAVFVDKSGEAISVIKKNIADLGCAESTRVLLMSDVKALALFAKEGVRFNMIYLDPPYALNTYEGIMKRMCRNNLIDHDASVIVETQKDTPLADEVGTLEIYKDKIYGTSRIRCYRIKR